jgi:hypothetical protein
MSTTAPEAENSLPANFGAARRRPTLVISFLLFLNFLYFLFSSGRVRTIDEVSAAFQVESLARHGTTAIPQAVDAKEFYGTMDRFGRPESPYPPGQALALLPWYAAGQFAGKHLPGVPPGVRDAVSDFFLTGESAFFSALAAALALYIFLTLGIEPKTSLLAAGILAFATPLAAYSGWLFSEPVSAAMLLGTAMILFPQANNATAAVAQDTVGFVGRAFRHDISVGEGSGALAPGATRSLSAGALLAAAIWVRPTHVIIVPVFLAALFIRGRKDGWKPAAALAAAVGVGILLLLWRNAYLHGSWLDFGYPAAAEGGKALNTFQTPLATGLLGFFVSPGKSIFLFSPPILLAMLGLPRLWRRDRGLAFVAATAPIVYLLFFATYTQWEGGYCYGPRYIVPALALLGLGVGPALEGASRNARILAVGVFVAGFFVQAIGSVTSFLEADVAGGYYDAQYNYRMSFSPIAMHIHLVLHYATSEAAPMGRGFDKWLVFLSKAGVSAGTLLSLASVLLIGAVASAWWLWQEYQETTAREEWSS